MSGCEETEQPASQSSIQPEKARSGESHGDLGARRMHLRMHIHAAKDMHISPDRTGADSRPSPPSKIGIM